MKKVLCFICQKDITQATKVVSFLNYPERFELADYEYKWLKYIPKNVNPALCSDCAKKDLEVAHAKATKGTSERIKMPVSLLEKLAGRYGFYRWEKYDPMA